MYFRLDSVVLAVFVLAVGSGVGRAQSAATTAATSRMQAYDPDPSWRLSYE